MDDRRLQDQTCRVAFAAFLHDLGKLAERARMQVEESKRLLYEQMYCPRREEGGRVGIRTSMRPTPCVPGT